jgi:hypothetical protein
VIGFKARILGSWRKKAAQVAEAKQRAPLPHNRRSRRLCGEKTQCKRDGEAHQRSGGNTGAAVNLQRIGAIACQGPLERAG